MRRGFKAEAERKSLDIRRRLGLDSTDACPARLVAGLLGVTVVSVQCLPQMATEHPQSDLPDTSKILEGASWLSKDESGFSAMAVVIGGFKMVLFNGKNSLQRQESDIMHELAHIICQHPGDCLGLNGNIGLRIHNEQYEEEAKWLGSALQIPDEGIFCLALAGHTYDEIAGIYRASLKMTNYRRQVLAIDHRILCSLKKTKK